MPTDPDLDAWRQEFVARRRESSRLESLQQAQRLAASQQLVLNHLLAFNYYRAVKDVFRRFQLKFATTKVISGEIPLDGQFLPDYDPIFVIDHQGLPGFPKNLEIPGLKYSAKIGYDEITLLIGFSRDDQDQLSSRLHLIRIDGRSHRVSWQDSLIHPSPDLLLSWLTEQLSTFLIPEPLP